MEILTEKDKWNNILNNNFQKSNDIFFKYEYFALYKKHYNVDLEGIYWEDNNLKIFWTHLIRDISKIELFKDFKYFDLATPYGFGGPLIIYLTKDENKLTNSIQQFFKEYENYCKKKRYISEFIRLHPFINNCKLLSRICSIKYMYDIVALDLTQDYENIWNSMRKKNRYYVRKAQKEFKEFRAFENPSFNEIYEFFNLYNDAMEKINASKKYFFSFDFIKEHFKFNTLLITCKNHDNTLGGSAMFLKGKDIIHYHLSARNHNFENSPDRAILWHAIKWAKEKELKWLNLGGGHGTNEDGLFKFKKEFSKTFFPFNRGEIIFNKEIFDELSSINPMSVGIFNFFPRYRIGIDSII